MSVRRLNTIKILFQLQCAEPGSDPTCSPEAILRSAMMTWHIRRIQTVTWQTIERCNCKDDLAFISKICQSATSSRGPIHGFTLLPHPVGYHGGSINLTDTGIDFDINRIHRQRQWQQQSHVKSAPVGPRRVHCQPKCSSALWQLFMGGTICA